MQRLHSSFAICLALLPALGMDRTRAEDPPAVPVKKLSVKSTATPTPALRYELLPNYREQVPGNAALSYHRAILMLNERRLPDAKAAYERNAKIDEMLSKPAKDVNAAELRDYLNEQSYRQILREIENGAKRDRCDWDLERRLDVDGIGILLPEVQMMRELARLLNVRCRLHIADRKVAEALQDVQYGFAMARHVGDGPTFIQGLVGMAVFQIFANDLERIIELPDCPNLYWSLTALPRPFCDVRKAIEGEMRTLEGTLPVLRDLEKGPMTIEQVQRALDQWAIELVRLRSSPEAAPFKTRLVSAAMVAMQYPNARRSLLEMGKTEAEIDAMPAGQAVLLEALLRFKSVRDEMFVWFSLPYFEGKQGMANASQKLRRATEECAGDPFGAMLMQILPATDKIYDAMVRADRKIAMLRTIEALRLYASANDNRFPAKLADITDVPIPLDPVTGNPFLYELTKDGKAFLTGPTTRGQQPNAGNTFKYELSLTR